MTKVDYLLKKRDYIWDKKIDYERDYPEQTDVIKLLNDELNEVEEEIFGCMYDIVEDDDEVNCLTDEEMSWLTDYDEVINTSCFSRRKY